MQPTLGRKALILSPAGQVYDRDNVRWYQKSSNRPEIITSYFNVGDMVVYDSTLKMLDLDVVQGVTIDRINDGEIAAHREAGFDFYIVRASNFIHNDMDWLQAIEVLDRLPLPIFAVGVGAQSSGRGVYALQGRNLRFWQMVSERSKVIGVRGTFTADVLAASGIKNVEIVGCPSMFRTRRRKMGIQAPTKLEHMAFSIRREADGTYASDVRHYREVQRDLMLACSRRYDVRVTIHGEPEEKAFFYGDAELMERAREVFRHEGWFTPDTEAEMERLYREKLFFFLQVADYDEFIRTQDFALGYRVHGVLPALANGVPGILVKYDSRSTELANTHAIPSVTVKDTEEMPLDDLLASVDYAEFNRVHELRYDKMRFVLEQNGLPHRL